jgi:hypothetical protein
MKSSNDPLQKSSYEYLVGSPSDPTGKSTAVSTLPQAASQETPLPERIGKYRVVERLGKGVQGEVFRAVHLDLGRDVVIKWASRHIPQSFQQ